MAVQDAHYRRHPHFETWLASTPTQMYLLNCQNQTTPRLYLFDFSRHAHRREIFVTKIKITRSDELLLEPSTLISGDRLVRKLLYRLRDPRPHPHLAVYDLGRIEASYAQLDQFFAEKAPSFHQAIPALFDELFNLTMEAFGLPDPTDPAELLTTIINQIAAQSFASSIVPEMFWDTLPIWERLTPERWTWD